MSKIRRLPARIERLLAYVLIVVMGVIGFFEVTHEGHKEHHDSQIAAYNLTRGLCQTITNGRKSTSTALTYTLQTLIQADESILKENPVDADAIQTNLNGLNSALNYVHMHLVPPNCNAIPKPKS